MPKYQIIENCHNYYERDEVSNSDLSAMEEQLSANDAWVADKTAAYRFGSLLDAIITEPERVDFRTKTIDGIPAIPEEWARALKMRKSFLSDEVCKMILRESKGQVVTTADVEFEFEGQKFVLPCRSKWDFFMPVMGYGADLKSTTATTQEQFEAACMMFNYDRQRAFYMNIIGSDYDVLIGISKVNFKVFKKFIKRGDSFFNSGMDKINSLAWKYYMLFG